MAIDAAVSGRQETGTHVAGEHALSGTHAYTAVNPARLSDFQGHAGPVFEDMLASVEGSGSRSQDGRRRPFQRVS